MVNQELLEILACPECHSKLALEKEKIVCVLCNRKFLINNGIPALLIHEPEGNLE